MRFPTALLLTGALFLLGAGQGASGHLQGHLLAAIGSTDAAAIRLVLDAKALVWLAAPLALNGMFWGIFHLDARLRGWNELAARFAAPMEAPAAPAVLNSSQEGFVGRVGMIQMRKMLRAAATPGGLYLAMPRWARATHPPLLIPWSQLRPRSCQRGITRELTLDLEAGRPAAGRILLRGGIAPAVLEKLGDPSSQRNAYSARNITDLGAP